MCVHCTRAPKRLSDDDDTIDRLWEQHLAETGASHNWGPLVGLGEDGFTVCPSHRGSLSSLKRCVGVRQRVREREKEVAVGCVKA